MKKENKNWLDFILDIQEEQAACRHKKTICLNEEGSAGVFCVDCGKRITHET